MYISDSLCVSLMAPARSAYKQICGLCSLHQMCSHLGDMTTLLHIVYVVFCPSQRTKHAAKHKVSHKMSPFIYT